MGSPLSCPIGSPSMPSNVHRGVPSLTSKTAPSPHPLAIHPAGPENDAGVGTFHNPLMTRLRVTLKSERPLVMLMSHHGMVGVMLFEYMLVQIRILICERKEAEHLLA